MFSLCRFASLRMLTERLSPYFEVDYLLPRTLMSVMSCHHLPEFIEIQLFPPEVCLGAVFFYFTNINYDHEMQQVIYTISDVCAKCVKAVEDI